MSAPKNQHQWHIQLKATCDNCGATHMVPLAVRTDGTVCIGTYNGEDKDVPDCGEPAEKEDAVKKGDDSD